jgi:hypothetical protein
MLYQTKKETIQSLFYALMISVLSLLQACMPTSTAPALKPANNSSSTTSTQAPTYDEPTYPLPGIFVQEGSVRSSTSISLPLDFNDSFLIRGKSLSQLLRKLPNTTKFCLAGKFNYQAGSDKFLLVSAKPKSFTDLINKTTEFYLQVEPGNDTANQNDCLSYNLTSALLQNTTNPSVHFSLNQLCTNCSSMITSSGLLLYFVNGEQVPDISLKTILMTISASLSNTTNSCSESTSCISRGFNCCLEGQCVNDGALRPGSINQPGFLSAQEDVSSNPDRFVVYPQFYFVCGSRPNTIGNDSSNTSLDPEYDAQIRLLELSQLYQCLNKVEGEFSYCTLKYTAPKMPATFSAANEGFKDDINFSSLNPSLGTGTKANNIVKIVYGGKTIYDGSSPLRDVDGTFGAPNDNLSSTQSLNLKLTLPQNAKDGNLYISYKIDGTCEKLSTNMAKCSKTYVQSSSDSTSTTWHDSSKTYLLPSYADTSTSANLIVKVSGVVIPEGSSTWAKYQSPNRIVFSGSFNIYQNQVVEITYFVTSNAPDLIKFKTLAQQNINTVCSCTSSSKCNLRPVLGSDNVSVTDYECIYPMAESGEPPVNQTVYVSNKNIAHRYYDTNGVLYDSDYGGALTTELNSFSYISNNILKPNNVNQYVGFNEIYGQFAKSGNFISRPAKMVRVKKDKLYDILSTSGSFSSCTTCGNDYYSILQKIFPQNFLGLAGGYSPDNFTTRRENSSSLYRSDDLLFGRACFVPATMIPWTHTQSTTVNDQRRARLTAQHFLFANGYNRDWFGFDYGSLIGSFDGVNWFSIGNQRRIKAITGKLYLAVNAYLGDLNVDNNFTVTVAESSSYSSEIPDHDTKSDGAECQRSHYCSNDNDCFRQLGYDYSCQNITGLTTPWPQFDATGSEIVGSNIRTLSSIVGGTNGQAKRCVYRGRGAPCVRDLNNFSSTNFSSSSLVGTVMCSHNNSCVPLATLGRFNDRIARFASTPLAQNLSEAAPTLSDTFGLGARIILRPFEYYGTKNTPEIARATLAVNNVTSICIPGRDVLAGTDTYNLNLRHPTNRTDTSDKILGIGPTTASQSLKSLDACPATDDLGQSLQTKKETLGNQNLSAYSISQNLSTNLLDLAPLRAQNILSSINEAQVTAIGYQKNACLRAPGAACFSDLECAPSEFIAGKVKTINLTSILNPAEIKFWEEELVCGNPDFKYTSPGYLNNQFDIKKNKCCREYGKKLTVFTQMMTSSSALGHQWCNSSTSSINVAGVNQSYTASSRYSRVHTAFDKMTCNRSEISSSKTFALSLEANNATNRMTQILGQYKTLDTINQRTCCSNHWVRSFHSSIGGGHAFNKSKQDIKQNLFRDISWEADDTSVLGFDPDSAFECSPEQYLNASCEIKNLTPQEEEKYLTWAGSLELIGIPQVAIKTNDDIFRLVNENQVGIAGIKDPLLMDGKYIMKRGQTADFTDTSGKNYYSAASYDKLNMGTGSDNNSLKKIFSESEFNCCIPSGQELPETITPGECCTGFSAEINKQKICCLPDFTDVTLYLNRYVSSEGRGLSDSAYDPATGYIKDPAQVSIMAAQKRLCCSGQTMAGVAISQLPIPLTGGVIMPANGNALVRRFTYRDDQVDNNAETGSVGSFYNAGVRWNNHVYCIPESVKQK